jgi:hypothetical protein
MVALVLRASPPGEAAIMNVNDVLLLEVVTMMITMPLLLDITITTHCYLFSGKIKYGMSILGSLLTLWTTLELSRSEKDRYYALKLPPIDRAQ